MGFLVVFMYLGSSLFVMRGIFDRSEGKSKWLIVTGIAYLSPLLALGWLQEKARNTLDIWFEAKG